MAYTQDDIDALKEAIATGARRVKFGSGADSREVEYRSLDDMMTTLAFIESQVNPQNVPPSRSVGVYHSGLTHGHWPYGEWDCRGWF
ncbi:phage head-tail joining protein [Bradyrhizobium sp. BTAi1]|jgi:hypothetical protein|uniref:phage head-tail joining protein n=1 Tax=Bradyrhizobium sp. (strain BTAi1 / ATCC BAA-1182) TaxID=288000 RepID=UPI00005DF63A|nr:hypothetical protein [Bradyrhizobium sp. BTAi1]ABQ38502.1 hypothetical protein BBta_6599 [Bradyrhizobium sp. BTAi1]